MKKLSCFLMIILIIGTLTIGASGVNNSGTYELEYPSAQKIERLAYDSADDIWSEAQTSASNGLFGHNVSAGSNVYSNIDPFLYGSWACNAVLNHDWVSENRYSDNHDGEWERYLNKDAYTSDTDWGETYNESDTIQDCGADSWATARDTRTPSVLLGTSVRIPW